MFDDAYNWVKGKLGKESKASESEKLECPNCKNKGGLFESTFAKNGYLCEYCDADITDEAIADWNDVDWLDLDNLLDTKESKASEDYLVTVRNKNDDWNSLDDTWVNTAEDARKVKSEKESQYSNNSNVVVRIANYNTHTNYGKNDGYESKAKEGGYGSGKNRHGFGHKKWMKNAEINDSIIDNPFTKEYDKLLRSNSEMDYND